VEEKQWYVRRKFPRFEVDWEADCTKEEGVLLGRMLQIGAKGAFFVPEAGMMEGNMYSSEEDCSSFFNIKEDIIFTFKPGKDKDIIEIKAKVVHISRREGIQGIGVEFENVLSDNLLSILKIPK